MVEGGGSKTFGRIKRMMYESPEVLHRLLEVLARSTILYLNAQIAAGAQAVMVFDTWGGVLTPRAVRGVLAALHGAGHRRVDEERGGDGGSPNIVFTKGGGAWLQKIAAIGCDAVGVGLDDRPVDGSGGGRRPRRAAGKISIPRHCFAPPDILRAETLRVLGQFLEDGDGHVFNLGPRHHTGCRPGTGGRCWWIPCGDTCRTVRDPPPPQGGGY